MSEAYRAGPWKCAVGGCHDREQHHHSYSAMVELLAAERKASEELRASRDEWKSKCERSIAAAEGLCLSVDALSRDRDEWKQATIDGNIRFKDAEEQLRALRSGPEEEEVKKVLAWLESGDGEGSILQSDAMVLARSVRSLHAKLAETEAQLIDAHKPGFSHWKKRAEAAEKSLATRTEERDSYLDAVTLAESALSSAQKQIEAAASLVEWAIKLDEEDNCDCSDLNEESGRSACDWCLLRYDVETYKAALASLASAGENALCDHERPFCHDTPTCSRGEPATGKPTPYPKGPGVFPEDAYPPAPVIACACSSSKPGECQHTTPAPVESVKPKGESK